MIEQSQNRSILSSLVHPTLNSMASSPYEIFYWREYILTILLCMRLKILIIIMWLYNIYLVKEKILDLHLGDNPYPSRDYLDR